MDLKILIIDDDESIAELTKMLFEELGAYPTICFSPDKALELLRKEKFDLILSDFRFREYNAIELLHKINELLDPIPNFVIITGLEPTTEEKNDLLKHSCKGFLDKPLEVEALENLLGL